MPVLDLERNVVVIRIVYDGPPEAGKTTSLRALSGSFGKTLFTPEEHEGRTIFFDWMDYTAGRFEGRQIRCQVVSVPGQRSLMARRRRLLQDADVIVFVADSARPKLDAALVYLADLPEILAEVPPPSIGLVLQANKRDLPDAVPLPELRARLDAAGCRAAIMESIAMDRAGIRDTFIFAVRLALDRVRELLDASSLAKGRPGLDSGEALLEWMQSGETASAPEDALAVPAIEQVLAENELDGPLAAFTPWRAPLVEQRGGGPARAPRPPDPTAPSGTVWPPVDGRVILHEAAASGLLTHHLRDDDWAAGIGTGWRMYTSGGAVFDDVDQGRATLARWARLHSGCARLLSPRRCIVLVATGDGRVRLWQIVRSEASLRDGLDDLDERDAPDATRRLLDAAALLVEMDARLHDAPCDLPCNLDTIGRGERGPVYIGLMPAEAAAVPERPRGAELVKAALGPILAGAEPERRQEIAAALARLRRDPRLARAADLVAELLDDLAAGEPRPRRQKRP